MRSHGLIAGINWAIAVTAVAGTVFVISQIFAPIPPTTLSVGAPDTQVQQLKSANESLPSNRRETGTSTFSQQSTATQVKGQQGSFQAGQLPRNDSAGLSPTAGSGTVASQNGSSAPGQHPQPVERPAIAPMSSSPPPSVGTEGLPDYLRYF